MGKRRRYGFSRAPRPAARPDDAAPADRDRPSFPLAFRSPTRPEAGAGMCLRDIFPRAVLNILAFLESARPPQSFSQSRAPLNPPLTGESESPRLPTRVGPSLWPSCGHLCLSQYHFCKDATNAPDIHSCRIELAAQKDLGGAIPECHHLWGQEKQPRSGWPRAQGTPLRPPPSPLCPAAPRGCRCVGGPRRLAPVQSRPA